MTLHLLALTAGLLCTADAPKDEAGAKALKELQGTWVVVGGSAKKAGFATESSGEPPDTMGKMTFAGDRWTFKLNLDLDLGGVKTDKGEGTVTLDPSKDPRRIEIRSGGKVVRRGVYKLEGNRLTIRLNPASEKQPAYPAALQPEDDRSGVALNLQRVGRKKER
jgi:uncharacterized protein (TIGR03067 family)